MSHAAEGPIKLTPQMAVERVIESGIEKKRIEYKVQRSKLPYDLVRAQFDSGMEISTAYEVNQLEKMSSMANIEDRNKITGVRFVKRFSTGTNFEVGYNRLDQTSILSPSLVGTRPDDLSQSIMSVKIKQSLLQNSFGSSDRRQLRIAKANFETASLASEEDLENLVLSSLSAYWMAYVAKQNLKESIKARDLIDDLVKQVQRKAKVGFTGPGELPQALAEFEKQDQFVKMTSHNYIDALETLLVKMDMKPGTPVQLEVSNELPPLPEKSKYDTNLNRYMRIANKSINSSELVLSNVKSQSLPSLDLNFQWDSSGIDENPGKAFSEMSSSTQPRFFVGLSLKFFIESSAQESEIMDKKVALLDAQANQSWLQMNMEKEQLTIYNKIIADNKVAKSTKKMVILREKVMREMQKAYRQGRVDLDKVISAHREVFVAKVALIRAIGDYRMVLNQWAASHDQLVPAESLDGSGS